MTMIKKEYYLGIDVGGQNIKYGIWDKNIIIDKNKLKTPQTLNEFISELKKIIKDYQKNFHLTGIGIGLPGVFDIKTGIMHDAVHMKFINGHNFYESFSEYKENIFFDNDANFATLGQYLLLPDKNKFKNVLFLTLGSGVGTGIIIDGKLYRGERGYIEGGHVIVEPEGVKCNCGSWGCLETIVSVEGLLRMYKEIKGELLYNTNEILKRAENGEEEALKVYEKFGYYLGIGITSMYNLISPELIILGGGLSYHNKFFLSKTIDTIKIRSYIYKYSNLNIRVSELGNDAGIIGAASFSMISLNKKNKL